MATKRLDAAKENKDDEFYTQISDIEKELSHYKDFLENKQFFAIVMILEFQTFLSILR